MPQPINIFTIQVGQWRKVPKNIRFFDVTVKSGVKDFAPLWGMLMDYKQGRIDEYEYTRLYLEIMRDRIRSNPAHFRETILEALDGYEGIAFACYCAAGKFCHRHLLTEGILPQFEEELGFSFNHKGEVK